MNIPSACRIANIALKDAMILPYDANPGRMEFSERTATIQIPLDGSRLALERLEKCFDKNSRAVETNPFVKPARGP